MKIGSVSFHKAFSGKEVSDGKSINPRIDIFDAELLRGATPCGSEGVPLLEKTDYVPKDLVSWANRCRGKETQWLHFYIHDYQFDSVWPIKRMYLKTFRRFEGVITPDYSVYHDMPPIWQKWNTYRSRVVGFWLQGEGIKVIPNVRWGDGRTFSFAFDGIQRGGTVAVGANGCTRAPEDRVHFLHGFKEMLGRLCPKVVVYGRLPEEAVAAASGAGAEVVEFETEFAKSRRM
jgi:hypothetical protein